MNTPKDDEIMKLADRLLELAGLEDPTISALAQLKKDLYAAALLLRKYTTALQFRCFEAPDYVLRDVAADYYAYWPENFGKPVRFLRAVTRADAWAVAHADGYDQAKERWNIRVYWFDTEAEAALFLASNPEIQPPAPPAPKMRMVRQ